MVSVESSYYDKRIVTIVRIVSGGDFVERELKKLSSTSGQKRWSSIRNVLEDIILRILAD